MSEQATEKKCVNCMAFFGSAGRDEGICAAWRVIKKLNDTCRHFTAKASAPVKAAPVVAVAVDNKTSLKA
jgi:hypothetical protein